MLTINTMAGTRDLMALTREIEVVEDVTRRAALVRALHQMEEITAMVQGDVRYVPVGWRMVAHVSWSIGRNHDKHDG